jgi:hypothetical protein
MEFEFATARNMRLGALVMARGEFCVEVLEPDECVAFVLLRGCLQITRQRAGEPASYCLHATPRAARHHQSWHLHDRRRALRGRPARRPSPHMKGCTCPIRQVSTTRS